MNWKKEAAEKLRLHEKRKNAMESMRREMGVDSGGLDGLVRMRELQGQYQRTKLLVDAVETALGTLDWEERIILDRLYLHPIKNGVDWLCGQLECEVSSVYRRRDKALRDFTVAMYGFVN